ncbi:MAG TPA: hypothetical protein VNU68_27610 [Verrucomicrobiae bacterium]|nr:hypothetical protein [Verrucomicrobiae bacterium]
MSGSSLTRMRGVAALMMTVLSLWPVAASALTNKTLRAEHGRPLVIVSDKAVLWLEFLKESVGEALVPHREADIRHCRAQYRYQLYDGITGSITNGHGVVEEVYQVVVDTPAGRQLKDVGCRVGISAGEFYLWWSEGGAGARSWIYYRTDSPIRFLQQPLNATFEMIDAGQFRRYLSSRNVQEFVAAGKTVQVLGPAVFSGDWPTETPTAARIESGRVHRGIFELKLSSLGPNKHYIIERSYELKSGNWTTIHAFTAREVTHEWSDPLNQGVDVMFYRIREGSY